MSSRLPPSPVGGERADGAPAPVDLVTSGAGPTTMGRRGDVSAADAAYARFRSERFFGCLDGLRALSIVAVIWHHTAPVAPGSLLHRGNQGVTLFFAISGFLIVTLILRAKEEPGRFTLPVFWGRRMMRIFPLYFAVLAVYTLAVWTFERHSAMGQAFFANLPSFATFTSNWFVDLSSSPVIFYFAWSLAAEEQFYLLWPVIERYLRGWWPLVLAAALLAGTQVAAFLAGPAARSDVIPRILTSVPAAILLGVVLAHLLHRRATFGWIWRVAGRRGSAVAAATLALLAVGIAPVDSVVGALLVACALAGLVATCVIREDNDLAPSLRWRSLAWLGTVSYGMYLTHMLCVNAVRRIAGMAGVEWGFVDFVAGTALTAGVATLSYLSFERYFSQLKERWFPVPASDPSGSAGATTALPPVEGVVAAAP